LVFTEQKRDGTGTDDAVTRGGRRRQSTVRRPSL